MIVDLFAGGGGASTGIEAALGRSVDVAINHDPIAMAVHCANHPATEHLTRGIWEVDPLEATKGRPVELLWASPDCTHFSVAKGGKPRRKKIRSLAWAVVRWAQAVRPSVICLENVREFQGWGPLDKAGQPIKARMGETFDKWRRKLERLGYVVDHRILDASLYGAPTRRRRLFLVARCDGQPIRWPKATHGLGGKPLHTAAECIDWAIPCPSIFERKKPLAEKTMWRIAQGIKRFVLENPKPFIVKFRGNAHSSSITDPLPTVTGGGGAGGRPAGAAHGYALAVPSIVPMNADNPPMDPAAPLGTVTSQHNRFQVVAPTLIQTSYGERKGQSARVLDLFDPLGTVVAQGVKHSLVAAFLEKGYSEKPGRWEGAGSQPVDAPAPTITTRDHTNLAAATLVKLRGTSSAADIDQPAPTITAGGFHLAEVRAFLTAFYGNDGTPGKGQDLFDPMRTVTTKARLGLVTVEGVDYQIIDIGMRMLEPHELLRAQFGRFAASYDLSLATTKSEKVRLIGNSVAPEVAEALIRANMLPIEARAAA